MSSDAPDRERPQTASERAARWWADFLRYEFTHETGDFKTTSYANYFAPDETFAEETIEAFEHALTELLRDQARPLSITVDYDPDPLLVEAAEQAGIDVGRFSFPVKTSMRIGRHEIFVVPGEGVRRITLEEWYQEGE